MSRDFLLRALVKFTDINSSNDKYYDLVKKMEVDKDGSDYVITLSVNNNAEYNIGQSINITNVSGLPNIVRNISSLEDDDKIVISGSDTPTYSISYFETYSQTVQVGVSYVTYYYMRAYVDNGHVMVPGSQVKFASVSSPLNGVSGKTLTVYSSNEYMMVFRSADPATDWEIATVNFPSLNGTPVPPNTYPLQNPLVTNGLDSIASVEDSNGLVSTNYSIASISPHYDETEGYLTDHNRSPLQISFEEVEEVDRTVDGTLRWRHNASKRKFALSWKDLPADSGGTVDGFYSGKEMLDVFNNNKGSFTIEIYNRESARKTSTKPDQRATVRFVDFTYSVTKRNFHIEDDDLITDLWDVSMSLEEV